MDLEAPRCLRLASGTDSILVYSRCNSTREKYDPRQSNSVGVKLAYTGLTPPTPHKLPPPPSPNTRALLPRDLDSPVKHAGNLRLVLYKTPSVVPRLLNAAVYDFSH